MSIYKNGKLIAGGRQTTPLLSFMWADHILDDISWLRADTFSWQNGAVYQAVYQHLANDIDGKLLQSETVGGITIQFYLADDGHKICPESEMNNVIAIYNAIGVAWYYVLDTVNERFKLPRTKFGFTGLRGNVGKYVAPGLPNIEGTMAAGFGADRARSGAFSGTWRTAQAAGAGTDLPPSGNDTGWEVKFNASKANSIYGNSTTVQPPATQMYLYFYVGNFTQTALENTAGVSTEILNDLNEHKVIAFQTPKAANNYTWYRKYADGWVEQGGKFSGNLGIAKTLPITMANTNYQCSACCELKSGHNWDGSPISMYASTTTQVLIRAYGDYTDVSGWWQVCGMAAN